MSSQYWFSALGPFPEHLTPGRELDDALAELSLESSTSSTSSIVHGAYRRIKNTAWPAC
jgi:hypothetical protein